MSDSGGITVNGVRELVRLRRKLDQGISGGRGVRIVNKPDGLIISLTGPDGGNPIPATPTRMKIKDSAPKDPPESSTDAQANVVIANVWDGNTLGLDDIPVRTHQSHSDDDEILTVQPAAGVLPNDSTDPNDDTPVEVTYNGLPVVWEEVHAGEDPTFIVYIDVPAVGTTLAGLYDGYCYKTFVASVNPATDTKCLIKVEEEQDIGTNSNKNHWSKGYAIGRFCGNYTSDTPPRMIIHATGFEVWQTDHNNPFAGSIPNAGTQEWNRAAEYLPATAICGDVPGRLEFAVRGGKFRRVSWDASGRIYKVEAETA